MPRPETVSVLKAFERLPSVEREFRQIIYICEIQRITAL